LSRHADCVTSFSRTPELSRNAYGITVRTIVAHAAAEKKLNSKPTLARSAATVTVAVDLAKRSIETSLVLPNARWTE